MNRVVAREIIKEAPHHSHNPLRLAVIPLLDVGNRQHHPRLFDLGEGSETLEHIRRYGRDAETINVVNISGTTPSPAEY